MPIRSFHLQNLAAKLANVNPAFSSHVNNSKIFFFENARFNQHRADANSLAYAFNQRDQIVRDITKI